MSEPSSNEVDPAYRVLDPNEFAEERDSRMFAIDVLHGLSGKPKRLSSKYFYDDVGSELFANICDLDEYYPTRVESEILERHAVDIAHLVSGGAMQIVDLGAGDGRKTRVLLEGLESGGVEVAYRPIDISEGAMAALVERARGWTERGDVEGIVGEYFDGIHWIASQTEQRNLVLFLGSNIGNFDYAQARRFLRQLWDALNPDDLVLIGFDLKKDIEVLLAAYNDRKGLTAKFNLNLLTRINRELGADFDLDKWRHYGTYDVFAGAMKSYLVSMDKQVVTIDSLSQSFAFDAWEPIHTEYSYKYLESDVSKLAHDTGFAQVAQYFDRQRWFTDCVWRVVKSTTTVRR